MKFETIDDLRNSKAIILDFWEKYLEIGDVLMSQDIFVNAILHRISSVNEAFNELTSDEFNYIGAVPLIRLQIDTLLYCYAGSLVEDFNVFLECFLSGRKWTNLKDREGNELSEKYLLQKLSEIYKSEGLTKIYKETSDYIHLSNSHLYMTLIKSDNGDLNQRVGEFSFCDNENDILDIMLVINQLIMRIIVFTYVQARYQEMDIFNDLRAKYPEKSDAELIYQFGINYDKVEDLFFSQLRTKQ